MQYELRHERYRAAISSVGASLRSLTFGGRDLVVAFDADEVRPAFRGATLVPWPNRVVDGRYEFDGVAHQLALTEPARGHALHGLVAWADFRPVEVTRTRVTLATEVVAQAGYPWRLAVESTYRLGADGLTQEVRIRNLSQSAAPCGTGPHPYLVAGDGTVDDWTLQLPAASVLEVSEDRLAPRDLQPVSVDASRFDFRSPRRIQSVQLDHAFTGLIRDPQARATVRVTAADGTGVELQWDVRCPWVQIHTADMPTGRESPGHRAGLAVEPMTCAPDAFNDAKYQFDTGLLRLAAGDVAEASWTIRAIEGTGT